MGYDEEPDDFLQCSQKGDESSTTSTDSLNSSHMEEPENLRESISEYSRKDSNKFRAPHAKLSLNKDQHQMVNNNKISCDSSTAKKGYFADSDSDSE